MANVTNTNPMVLDTGATIAELAGRRIRLIQWIDDNADIADDDVLIVVINGCTMTGKLQMTTNTLTNLAVWTFGPFDHGFMCNSFAFTTPTHGVLWVLVE